MNKILLGTILGVVFGIIDIIPMLLMKTGIKADLSAFVHWVVVGFLVGALTLPLPPVLQGLFIAIITTIPILLIVSDGHLPIIAMTIVLGSALGFLVGKLGK